MSPSTHLREQINTMTTTQASYIEADLQGQKSYDQLIEYAEQLGTALAVPSDVAAKTSRLLSRLRAFDEQTAKESIQSLGLALAVAGVYQQFYHHSIPLPYVWSAALLHDIGKVQVGEALIRKSNRGVEWTDQDRQQMCAHPQAGFEIAQSCGLPYSICRAIAEHHSRQPGPTYGIDACLNNEERIIRDSVAVADFADAALNRTNTRNALMCRGERLAEVRADVMYVFNDYERGRELAGQVYQRLTQPIHVLA